MKCSSCGTEFYEGVFCPECGMKYSKPVENTISPEAVAKAEAEKAKAEFEMEKAKINAEVEKEKARVEQEKARVEADRLAKEQAAHEAEIAKQQTEQARIVSEHRLKENEINAQAEKERLAKERAAHEAELARQKTEQERLANERIQRETELAKLKIEQEKIEHEKAEALVRAQEEIRLKKLQEREGMTPAIISLVMGIIALISFGCLFVPEILGIVFAFKGKKNGKMRWESKAGMIMSIIATFVVLISISIGIYYTFKQ